MERINSVLLTTADKAVEWYTQAAQWHGWPLITACMIFVYVVAYFDVRSKRDKAMDPKKFRKHQGPKVEYLIYKVLGEARIKDEISDATYFYWARWFGWHGFDKFKVTKKIFAGSPRAERLKETIAKRLGREEPVKLP